MHKLFHILQIHEVCVYTGTKVHTKSESCMNLNSIYAQQYQTRPSRYW